MSLCWAAQELRSLSIVHLTCSCAASTVIVSGEMIECRAMPSTVVNSAVAVGATSAGSRCPSSASRFSHRCRLS